MKRLCIYLTYDRQNVVDEYIGYMLRQLKTCTDRIVVVCNTLEIARGKEILEKYADEIFYRQNIGLDVGGWKDAMCRFIGWDKVLSFDEVILANDSFFGPFRPMTEVFDEMGQKQVDFWGLSMYDARREPDNTEYPPHIQSYFITVRTKMLHSEAFRNYWGNMPYYDNYNEVVKKHESMFTAYFEKQGFSWGCLADMGPNNSEKVQNNFNQYGFLAYELIRKRNFPFLKKQSLTWNTVNLQTQENLRQAFYYIDKHTDYDINLIWENIIRTLDISDLQRNLHLQYIISPGNDTRIHHPEITVAVFVDHSESGEYIQEYLEQIDYLCKVNIYSQHLELLDCYENWGYHCIHIDSAGGYESVLKELCNEKLVCVLHDTDVTGTKDPSCVGKSHLYNIWENLLKNSSYIGRIAALFEEEPKLGVLTPPEKNFGKYFGDMEFRWGECFDTVKNALDILEIRCQISRGKCPFAGSDNFWIRGEILQAASEKRIFGKKEISEEAFPYLWCYIAQEAGYYSGIVESAEYASMNEINLQCYLNTVIEQVRHHCGNFHDFAGMQRQMFQRFIEDFCRSMKHLYIFGTGIVAKAYHKKIPNFEAYVVSDGQPREETIEGKKVLYLSELEVGDDAGIVVCVGRKSQKQVVKLLEEKGWKNYRCI